MVLKRTAIFHQNSKKSRVACHDKIKVYVKLEEKVILAQGWLVDRVVEAPLAQEIGHQADMGILLSSMVIICRRHLLV